MTSRANACRTLVVLASAVGAIGVMLAAASAHLPDATRLASASSMAMFHALAVIGTAALVDRDTVHPHIGLFAGFAFILATVLFSGDLISRQYLSQGLFPMAAPTGGTLMIVSWIALAVAAVWPRKAT